MRVLLIDPPWFSLQGMSHAPLSLGLGYLGAYLKKNNHKCLIFSGEIGLTRKIMYQKLVIDEIKDIKKNPVWIKVLKKLSFLIKSFNPEIIGISVPTAKYGVVLELAKFLKKIKNVPIVAGGPHPTILPDEVIKVNEIDFVIRGEGEETMLDLVNALERKKALKK